MFQPSIISISLSGSPISTSLVLAIILLAAPISSVDGQSPSDNTTVTLKAAQNQFDKLQFELALNTLNDLIGDEGDFFDALRLRSECHHRLANWKLAVADLRRLVQEKSQEPEASIAIAVALSEASDLTAALAVAKDVVKKHPQSSRAHALTAWLELASQEKETEAIAKKSPTVESLEVTLKSALNHLSQAKSKPDHHADTLYYIGQAHKKHLFLTFGCMQAHGGPAEVTPFRNHALEQLDSAIRYFDRAIATDSRHVRAHLARYVLGATPSSEASLEDANKSLISVVELNPYNEFTLEQLIVDCWKSDLLDGNLNARIASSLVAAGPLAVQPLERISKAVGDLASLTRRTSENIAATGYDGGSVAAELARYEKAQKFYAGVLKRIQAAH